MTNLEFLSLGGNALTGSIPPALGSLVNLQVLSLGGNALTGSIPPALGSLVNLQVLHLSRNGFSGPIPSWLGDLTELRNLGLGDNDLTGPIPGELGSLVNLRWLTLHQNDLTGPIPAELGNLVNLEVLWLFYTGLSGPIPDELRGWAKLTHLVLYGSWGLSGRLPFLRLPSLRRLDVFATQTCAPAEWRDWLETREFSGRLCGAGADVTIDVAVVYTPAARRGAGGAAALEAVTDLMIAEANRAYAASGVHHRLALVARSEVAYSETGEAILDLGHVARRSEVQALRDEVGADLVHLIVEESNYCGISGVGGSFGVTARPCGGSTFTHELGHNMGLRHDRYQEVQGERRVWAHPAYGYVNQDGLAAGAPASSRWRTIMAYPNQCRVANVRCAQLLRFSNSRQRYNGDAMGIPYHGDGTSGLAGPADAAAVLNGTGPAVALRRERPPGANRPPVAVGTLADRELTLHDVLDVDASQVFADPDGEALRYTVTSSGPNAVTVIAAGARVTLTAVGAGAATIRLTATDPGGLSASHLFTVTVSLPVPFTDDPIVPGVTLIKAVHFTELRARIDAVLVAVGVEPSSWTDPVLTAGVTPVRLQHLVELREAVATAYRAAGQAAPRWTDAAAAGRTTPIRAVHLMELRAAVMELE